MSYRKKVDKWKNGEIEWDGTPIVSEAQVAGERMGKAMDEAQTSRILVQLRLDSLSSLFGLVSMLGEAKKMPEVHGLRGTGSGDESTHSSDTPTKNETDVSPPRPSRRNSGPPPRPLEVHGMRLVELTDRTSSVMQSAELDEFADQDFVFSAFRTFAQLHGMAVAGHVAAIPTSAYARKLVEESKEAKANLMIVPWSFNGTLSDEATVAIQNDHATLGDRFASRQHIDFVQDVLSHAACSTGIFISRSSEATRGSRPTLAYKTTTTGVSVHSARDRASQLALPLSNHLQHVFVPFIGGRDDQAALLFALQLAHNPAVYVTVVHIAIASEDLMAVLPELSIVRTTSGKQHPKETVDDVPSRSDDELLNTARTSVAGTSLEDRVEFIDIEVGLAREVTDKAVELAAERVARGKPSGGVDDLILVGSRHKVLSRLFSSELGADADFQKTVGVLGAKIAKAGLEAGLLVIHAAPESA